MSKQEEGGSQISLQPGAISRRLPLNAVRVPDYWNRIVIQLSSG
jgi:hypothetical protein